jgi:hypothetical protein
MEEIIMPKPVFPHEDRVTVDRKDGMSDNDDTVVAGDPPFDDPNEYPLDYNWTVKTYGGDDTVNLRNVTGVENAIETKDGNDLVQDSPFNDTIDLGKGDDLADMTSGMGYVAGGEGNDTIKVYLEQFMNPPEPPSDPGGPFWLNISGGSDKKDDTSIDTLQLYMTEDQVNEYSTVISQAFEDWKAGTIDPTFTMPQGQLHLGEVTIAAGSDPVSILINEDVENLQIINQDSGDQVVYDYLNPI